MKFSSLILATSLAITQTAGAAVAKRQSDLTDYLFVYFTGEGTENGEQVYMSVSNDNDPSSWTAVGDGPVLTSTVGETGVRDPSIIRSNDGSKFWVIATDLWVYPEGWDVGDKYTTQGSKGIVVWESSDLVSWSEPNLRIVSPDNAGMTWAPDAIWDPSREQYLVHWTTNLIDQGWYIMRCFTSDFVSFTEAEIWLEGAGMDTTVKTDGDQFYRISKNGAGDLIEQANAASLDGPWTVIKDGIGSPLPAGEGPLAFQSNADPAKWFLFIDDYTRGAGYQPFETNDITAANWAQASFSLDQPYRHGYVIGITADERAQLVG